MGDSWKEYIVGDIGRVVTGKTPPTADPENYGGVLPFITPSDMKGQKYIDITERTISVKGSKHVRNLLISPKTVFVSCIGSDMGKVGMTKVEAVTNQQINSIIVEDGIEPDYIYYNLFSRKDELQRLATSGSAQPILNKGHFSQLRISLPPLLEQKAIASILGALDDRIELNRKMNETLDAMARAIFKSWFVDFDPILGFSPHKEWHDCPLGKIPKGWRVSVLSDMLEILSGGTPRTSTPNYWDGDIPWFSVVDAPAASDVFVIDTEKHITQIGVENSAAKVLPKGTTIISARGTVGKLALIGVPMAMNQSCYGLRGKEGYPDLFVYFLMRCAVNDLQQQTHGTIFETVTRQTFDTVKIVLPPVNVAKTYEKKVQAYMSKLLSNLYEIRTLASIRDALLPKLLSGEMRVRDAEKVARQQYD